MSNLNAADSEILSSEGTEGVLERNDTEVSGSENLGADFMRTLFGQDNRELPGSEALREKMKQDILAFYEARIGSAETAEIVEASGAAAATAKGAVPPVSDSKNDQVMDLGLRSLKTDPDSQAQVQSLCNALDPTNAPEVRLQALYLLGEVSPAVAMRYLYDTDESIQHEAEYIAGVLPEE